MKSITLAVLLISTAFGSEQRSEDVTSRAMKKCIKNCNLPLSYIAKFKRFEFPNQVEVHHYLHCFWSELRFWNDKHGFDKDADIISDLPYSEKLTPIVEGCNQNQQKNPPPKWVYSSYKCILNSSVGEELKQDISRRLIG